MKGSLQTKNNIYYTVLSIKDKNGKFRTKWQTTGLKVKGNKRRAEAILQQRIAEYEETANLNPAKIPFAEWMTTVVEERKATIAPTTFNSYYDMVKLHIAPYFSEKNTLLTTLTAGDLETYYSKKIQDGLSPNTVQKHHALIHSALKKAMKQEYIHKNVAELADAPKRKKASTPEPYNKEELMRLLAVFREDVLYYVVAVAVIFGLRHSEILGLRWERIDLDKGTMHIDTTALRCVEDGKVTTKIQETTKTASSCRSFLLTKTEIDLFLELKERQEEYRWFFKKDYYNGDADFVFLDEKGYLIQLDYVTHNFKKVLRKNNLREIRFHDLRHSCATALLYSDYHLKDIQKWLGHSNYQFTADTYVHADNSMKYKMAETMDALLSNPS